MRICKIIVSLISVLALAFALCACNIPGGTSQPQESAASSAVSEPEQSVQESSEPEPELPLAVIEAPEVIRVLEPRGREETPDLLSYAATDGENLRIMGTYDPDVPGVYGLSFAADNAQGKTTERPFTLKVLALAYNEEGQLVDGEYETVKGYPLVVKDGIAYIDGILLANKTYPLPSDYLPGGILPEAEEALAEMRAAAPAELRGRVYIRSGYRSYAEQRYIYNSYLLEDPKEVVDSYSARPGHSEHQSGLAMDILCASTALSTQEGYKDVLDWLGENAWKYGFILRYPDGKTDETGYIFEPWHYRYVGKELAEILYADGEWITVEDYFGIDSEYKY
ncbi:MAG: M15 family metallopeptidase [Clostridia bacterium]|nr:M15 family metallopeptidase [Clostridia bacterium]